MQSLWHEVENRAIAIACHAACLLGENSIVLFDRPVTSLARLSIVIGSSATILYVSLFGALERAATNAT